MATRRRWTFVACLLAACSGSLSGADDAGGRDARASDSAAIDAAIDARSGDARASLDVNAPDAFVVTCPATAFCESFDDYTETTLVDAQTFGPWRASLSTSGARMDLGGTHVVSGSRALHVSIDSGATAGGRLYARNAVPLVAAHPTHVYGRMRMFVEPSGTSIHWTFFGVEGPADSTSPAAGRSASYIMSSLPRAGVNTFSFVDGLGGGANYQDCWNQSMTPMPVGRWTCVSFEMDSVARHLAMSIDGTQIMVVDQTGQGCVSPVAGSSPWYGPEVAAMFVGAWSFHPMDAPLEVWIDDLVVDTSPVACP